MPSLTVTAKGQVTLRRDVLEHLGVKPGDRLEVEKLPDGRVEVRALPAAGRIEDIFGALERPDRKPLSIAEMNQFISEGWTGAR